MISEKNPDTYQGKTNRQGPDNDISPDLMGKKSTQLSARDGSGSDSEHHAQYMRISVAPLKHMGDHTNGSHNRKYKM